MELSKVFIKIGTVKQILDNGMIKARVEGSFDDDDLEKLPPIRYSPFTGSGTYSTPYVGERVWVMGDHSDPLALFWFPINETSFPQNSYPESEQHKEMLLEDGCSILIKKPMAGGLYDALYYIDNNGCHIQDGDTILTISDVDGVTINAKKITLGDKDTTITLRDGDIQLANSDVVDKKLTQLSALITKVISTIEKAAMANIYTTQIGVALTQLLPDIAALKADIESTGSGVMA